MEWKFETDGPVLDAFMQSRARVALIQGPRGSGKSNGAMAKLLMNALRQRPSGQDGKRRRRAYVVRQTYDELKRTTVQSWLNLFPEERFGQFRWAQPFEHRIRIGDLMWDVVFLAIERPEDAKKLLSAEASDLYFNEFREIDRKIFDDAFPIMGRYPPKTHGGCPDWQIVGDTNAPSENHWFAVMSGQVPMPESLSEDERRALTKPAGWEFFMQPPGMLEVRGPDGEILGYETNRGQRAGMQRAENLRWLNDDYYEGLIEGKTRSWIKVNALNKPAQLLAGRSVWPTFNEDTHVARSVLEAYPGHPLLVGVDFGRTPAAIVGQRVFDRWFILDELVGENIGARKFARLLKQHLGERFPDHREVMIWGDPAGEHLAEADDISPFLMFAAEGLKVRPAPTNDPTVRVAAVEEILGQIVEGDRNKPRFLLSPRCVILKTAMESGYQYRKMQVVGDRYTELPDKNRWSHPADALQYLVMGAGEGRAVLRSSKDDRPLQSYAVSEDYPEGMFLGPRGRQAYAEAED